MITCSCLMGDLLSMGRAYLRMADAFLIGSPAVSLASAGGENCGNMRLETLQSSPSPNTWSAKADAVTSAARERLEMVLSRGRSEASCVIRHQQAVATQRRWR